MLYIFDWDGTIIDSTDKIIDCMQRGAEDASIEVLERDKIKNIIGLGLPEAFATLYPDLTSSEEEALRTSYVKHFIARDAEPCSFFPNVMDTLDKLRDAGHSLAVATGKSRRGLDRVLKNLDMEGFFHGSRCADETASKPDPLMLKQLLAEFDTEVHRAVMVGDTEYDMAMAHALNMPKIAVTYGAHHVSRLREYDPVLCADDFGQILDW